MRSWKNHVGDSLPPFQTSELFSRRGTTDGASNRIKGAAKTSLSLRPDGQLKFSELSRIVILTMLLQQISRPWFWPDPPDRVLAVCVERSQPRFPYPVNRYTSSQNYPISQRVIHNIHVASRVPVVSRSHTYSIHAAFDIPIVRACSDRIRPDRSI